VKLSFKLMSTVQLQASMAVSVIPLKASHSSSSTMEVGFAAWAAVPFGL